MSRAPFYSHQYLDQADVRALIEVFDSDFITQGPKIIEFEGALCKYTGGKYAVAVSSGTAALHIACLSLGIDDTDEVITSPLTFAASANCVLYCGGKPVFVDIQQDSGNIDFQKIEKKITHKTKAIIPVHFSGQPCNLKEIRKIAKKYKLAVIEDAAHALGAEYNDKRIGACNYSDMTIFSFHAIKSITTGEGGAVLTNNQKLYEKLLAFRNHGIIRKNFLNRLQARQDWYYEMQFLGYNYRMTDFQAALGISQLKKISRFIARRRQIANSYENAFRDNSYFELPPVNNNAVSSRHLFPLRLKEKYITKKKEIVSRMRAQGLGVQVHYLPVYLHPFYQRLGYKKGLCPDAETFYEREISIPIYPAMKEKQVKFVVEKIFKVFRKI